MIRLLLLLLLLSLAVSAQAGLMRGETPVTGTAAKYTAPFFHFESVCKVLSTGNGNVDYMAVVPCYKGTTTAATDPCLCTLVAEATVQLPVPGAITVRGMACALSAAPGSSAKTRTFTLMKANGSASTNITCIITDPATSCSVWPATVDAIASGALVSVKAITNQVSTTAANAHCVLYYTVDAAP